MKRVREASVRFSRSLLVHSVLNDESTANGKECALGKHRAASIEGGETHTVWVPHARLGRKHLVPVKNRVAGLIEFDPSLPR
jgi:hypothetical protein